MIENYETRTLNVTFGDEPPMRTIESHEFRWANIREKYLEYRFALWLDECGKEMAINTKS